VAFSAQAVKSIKKEKFKMKKASHRMLTVDLSSVASLRRMDAADFRRCFFKIIRVHLCLPCRSISAEAGESVVEMVKPNKGEYSHFEPPRGGWGPFTPYCQAHTLQALVSQWISQFPIQN
jgi:hypothetical protein